MSRKEEIIAGLIAARGKILEVAEALPANKRDEVFLGVWSLKDLLAHLVGWDYTNIEAVEDIRRGGAPAVFQHWDPDWVAYNARLVAEHKREDFAELLGAMRQSQQTLIDFIRTVPSDDIEKDFGIRSPKGKNITVEWFLQFEIDDEGRHYRQIQDWLQG
ncbi:MAG TPA: DinB family protein [Anaerolineales bacterium]|nr:DinB family protein [Anaerolineales bacterium]